MVFTKPRRTCSFGQKIAGKGVTDVCSSCIFAWCFKILGVRLWVDSKIQNETQPKDSEAFLLPSDPKVHRFSLHHQTFQVRKSPGTHLHKNCMKKKAYVREKTMEKPTPPNSLTRVQYLHFGYLKIFVENYGKIKGQNNCNLTQERQWKVVKDYKHATWSPDRVLFKEDQPSQRSI